MLRAALLVSALLWACGETAGPGADYAARGGSSASLPSGGAHAGSNSDPRPIEDASAIGGAGGSSNDSDAGPFAGAFNGSAGADGGSAGSDPSEGEPGGAGGAGAEVPRLCALSLAEGKDPFDQSALIGSSYWQVSVGECRYAGLSCGVDIAAQIQFVNGLRALGPELWGCYGLVAREFRIVYPGRTVTRADGEALIDLYVTLTMRKLLLSDSDAAGLRKQLLELLPASLAADAATISLCDSGGSCPSIAGAGGGHGGVGSAAQGGSANQAEGGAN
jgi:hypothetical protein